MISNKEKGNNMLVFVVYYRFLGHCDAVRFVHCNEVGDDVGLITCADDKSTRVWSATVSSKSSIKADNGIVSLVVLPGTQNILTLSQCGILRLWNWNTDQGYSVTWVSNGLQDHAPLTGLSLGTYIKKGMHFHM